MNVIKTNAKYLPKTKNNIKLFNNLAFTLGVEETLKRSIWDALKGNSMEVKMAEIIQGWEKKKEQENSKATAEELQEAMTYSIMNNEDVFLKTKAYLDAFIQKQKKSFKLQVHLLIPAQHQEEEIKHQDQPQGQTMPPQVQPTIHKELRAHPPE